MFSFSPVGFSQWFSQWFSEWFFYNFPNGFSAKCSQQTTKDQTKDRPRFLLRPFGLDPRLAPLFGIARSDAADAERYAWPLGPSGGAVRGVGFGAV